MKLYYHQSRLYPTNFGDALNTWLWPRLLPNVLDDDDQVLFVGIGTLLNNKIPVRPLKVVFGTGVGYGSGLPVIDEQWMFYCVRGPLSAEALGIDSSLAITDAAVLLRTLDMPIPRGHHKFAYIPHCGSVPYWDWEMISEQAGLHYINPLSPIEVILDEILSSDVVITEAMHGAIAADALRVPWIPVRAYDHILEFKWRDWCASVGVDYAPACIPSLHSIESSVADMYQHFWRSVPGRALRRVHLGSTDPFGRTVSHVTTAGAAWAGRAINERRAVEMARRLRQIANHTQPTISSEAGISSVTERLAAQLEQFRHDYDSGRFAEHLVRTTATLA